MPGVCPDSVSDGKFVDVQFTVYGRKAPVLEERQQDGPEGFIVSDRWNIGDAYVTLPRSVLVDGSWQTMPTGYPIVAPQPDGVSSVVTLRLPRGAEIQYGPSIEYGIVPNSATILSIGYSILFVLIVSVFLGVL